jgi:hypothetical protein
VAENPRPKLRIEKKIAPEVSATPRTTQLTHSHPGNVSIVIDEAPLMTDEV